eukprot:3671573-Rhodomonas_salina.2
MLSLTVRLCHRDWHRLRLALVLSEPRFKFADASAGHAQPDTGSEAARRSWRPVALSRWLYLHHTILVMIMMAFRLGILSYLSTTSESGRARVTVTRIMTVTVTLMLCQ